MPLAPSRHRLSLVRLPAAIVLVSQLLAACAPVGAAPPALPDAQVRWPVPQPDAWPDRQRTPPMAAPAFQAPSALHCQRPIRTREVPGQAAGSQHPRPPGSWESAGDAAPAARAESRAGRLFNRAPPGAPAPAGDAPAMAEALPAPAPVPQDHHRRHRPAAPTVTAGMVDDNADFAGYLAFRERTQVPHHPRDVRERYLLEVRDRAGRRVPDAEVAVRSPQGHAMWARTDTAGRAWLHPNAFDPGHASVYEVSVRYRGEQATAFLQRGRQSALEIRLGQAAATGPARLDLVFLIDATGSMADEIHKLKLSLRRIAAEVAALPSRPDLCFGLVAYRDRGDAFVLRSHDFTNDLNAFQQVLDRLHAAGGGDYPEALNEALHETVHRLSWRGDGATRLVVLLADAPPHLDRDGPRYDEDMMAALGKGIKVFSVGASGLDRQGEVIFRQVAQYTGGRFVFLTYAQADDPASGPGRETVHDVSNYSVDTLDRLIVRLVGDELAHLR